MLDVVLQIGKTQEKLENLLIVASRIRGGEYLRDVTRLSHQPIDCLLINRLRLEARAANQLGPFDYLFDEVIQANAVTHQKGQNYFVTSWHMAWAGHRGIPFSPGEGTGANLCNYIAEGRRR